VRENVGPWRKRSVRSGTGTRVVRGLQIAFLALLVGAFGLLASAVISGNWQIRPILSGSMQPGLPIGGVVVTQRVPISSLQVRDVVVFHPPNDGAISYVHRIISLKHTSGGVVVRTQGDDNLYPDPWTLHLLGHWAYQARFSLPLLGYVAVWVHSPTGRSAMLIGAAVLALILMASVGLDGHFKRRRRTVKQSAAGDGGTIPWALGSRPASEGSARAGVGHGTPTSRHRPAP